MNICALKFILPLISIAKGEALSDNLPLICDGTEDRFSGHFFFQNIYEVTVSREWNLEVLI